MIVAIEIPYYFKEVLATDFYHSETAQTQDCILASYFFWYKKILSGKGSLSNTIFSYIFKKIS